MKLLSFLTILMAVLYCSKSKTDNSKLGCMHCHKYKSDSIHKIGISCGVCHGGNSKSTTKEIAHKDFTPNPGDFSNVNKTCFLCHSEITQNILKSPMTTNHGMILTNRKAFLEEQHHKYTDIGKLDFQNSGADSYFSQLCASCHLGKRKKQVGEWKGYEKGGGCLACHLVYDTNSNKSHPRLQRLVDDSKCFNCHSRSSRISLNYRGWMELTYPTNQALANVLADGRKVFQGKPDIHYKAEMSCIDCHTSKEIMGTGSTKIQCTDCHKEIKILSLPTHIQTKIGNKSLSVPEIQNHYSHEIEHKNLDCQSCHSQWAPQCIGCHISYQPDLIGYNHITEKEEQGKWIEEFGEFMSELPTLGVSVNGKFKPFVPGMKLTIDTSKFYQKTTPIIEQNYFVPISPHTIGNSRDCKSCHMSPLALGYGRGIIEWTKDGKTKFYNKYDKTKGIPGDGWIEPFFQYSPDFNLSTHKENRPLNVKEQRKILKVGYCLQCHSGNSKVFKNFQDNINYTHLP
ncbi:MAG: cytochrome c3 family protein [Leptospiraceae bacterium]|nr:cytochrome c3 family protein [Leptospiraceae bacterium]